MTSCKEVSKSQTKKTKFIVEININESERDKVVSDLRSYHGWVWERELADIIEKG